MEEIKVLAQFDGVKVKPVAFRRQNRLYKIKKLNLVYRDRVGTSPVFYFFVSDSVNSYKLRFEPENLMWFIEN